MNNRRAWGIVGFVLIAAIAVFAAVLFSPSKKDNKKFLVSVDEGSYLSEENQLKITLFFQKVGSDKLIMEHRNIMRTSTLSSRAKQVLAELIAGSREGLISVLPKSVKVNELLVSPDGYAYVDFSQHIVSDSEGGTYNELMMINSIVNSLVFNFPEINKVQILVEGKDMETLLGHISLRSPLAADNSVIQFSNEGVFEENIPSMSADVQTTVE